MEKKKKALQLATVASMIYEFNMPNIKILQSLGFEVDVVADFTNPGTITETVADDFKESLIGMGVRVFDIAIPRFISVPKIICAYEKVKKLLNSERYDLIHCHTPIGGVICRVAARNERKKGTKVIYTAHGFHFYKGAPLKNWMIFYPIEKFCSRYTDVLITINNEDFAFAQKKMKARRVEYVPGVGIDLNKYNIDDVDRITKRTELGIKEEDFIVLSVGELSRRKNHEVVIRALELLKDKFNAGQIQYIICGKGKLKEYLQTLASDLKVQDIVHFVGYRKDILEICKASDLFVFMSYQEGLPVALMEAMAYGLPVVCSNIRGNTDLIDNGINGLICDSTPEQVADAINMMRKNKNLREKMASAALQKIKQFDLEKVNIAMSKLYKEMLPSNLD